ncbi:hypothetical protein ABPG74_009956 [Tetrahymena malaccensis]
MIGTKQNNLIEKSKLRRGIKRIIIQKKIWENIYNFKKRFINIFILELYLLEKNKQIKAFFKYLLFQLYALWVFDFTSQHKEGKRQSVNQIGQESELNNSNWSYIT